MPEARELDLSDPEVIAAVRAGDPDAFATLYSRHVEAARRLARTMVRPSDVDDIVGEAFARILSVMRDGGGPEVAFRAYLLTTVRNVCYTSTKRAKRVQLTEDMSTVDPGMPFVDTAVADLDQTLIARAFAKLPERWQTILWHTEVEGESPAVVAPRLGITPNNVSVMALRARERLKQHYLQEHIARDPAEECRWSVDQLGAYVRDGLSDRDKRRVDSHLAGCEACRPLFLELADVNASLRTVLAPIVLAEATAGYLATAGAGKIAGFVFVLKKAIRRRDTQIAAGGVAVVAAIVAAALTLTSAPAPPDAAQQSPAAQPPVVEQPAPPTPLPPSVSPPPAEEQPTPPPPAPVPGTMTVSLEPVGALVRGRPGVLAMTVQNGSAGADSAPAANAHEESAPLLLAHPAILSPSAAQNGSTGGALVAATVPEAAMTSSATRHLGAGGKSLAGAASPARESAFAGSAEAFPSSTATTATLAFPAPDSGPITAFITAPSGITLRAGAVGDGWSCAVVSGGIQCGHAALASGGSTRAYVPVSVASNAGDGPLQVRLTAPNVKTVNATAPRSVQSGGLPAVVAGAMPVTAAVAGNSLLSCVNPLLFGTCTSAREGRSIKDNGDFYMFRYADPKAPSGLPYGSMASSAQLSFSGSVRWAGLYWAGTGTPPATPKALIRGPGDTAYAKVGATKVDRLDAGKLGQPAYQAFADVTKLVRKQGAWWVSVDGDAFDYGQGSFGGWALVVLADSGGPVKCVSVLDGLTPLRDGAKLTTPLHGAPGSAQLGFVAWEGDRTLGGDQVRLGNTVVGGDNIMSGRASGTAPGWNTFGTDARILATRLSNTDLTFATDRDAYAVGPVIIVATCR